MRIRDGDVFLRAVNAAWPVKDPQDYPGRINAAAAALNMERETCKANSYKARGPSVDACRTMANWLESKVTEYQLLIQELRTYAAAKEAKKRVPGFGIVAHWDGPDKPARDRRNRKKPLT